MSTDYIPNGDDECLDWMLNFFNETKDNFTLWGIPDSTNPVGARRRRRSGLLHPGPRRAAPQCQQERLLVAGVLDRHSVGNDELSREVSEEGGVRSGDSCSEAAGGFGPTDQNSPV
jgi:hypothetical protein